MQAQNLSVSCWVFLADMIGKLPMQSTTCPAFGETFEGRDNRLTDLRRCAIGDDTDRLVRCTHSLLGLRLGKDFE